MKKLVSFVLATVLCLGMTTAVMAEGSPVISDEIKGTISEVKSDATNVTVKTFDEANYTAEVKEELAKVESNDGVLAEVKKVVNNATSVVEVVKFDLHADAAAEFKFEIAGINAGDKVLVLHFTNGAWKDMNATVNAEGEVVVNFADGYSPVMIIKYAVATPAPAPAPSAPATPVAPKTADVTMLGLVAVAALAGAVTAGRKVNK